MIPGSLTRRRLWRLLLGCAASFGGADRLPAAPVDQGIGGTGAAPPEPETSDRGIGGTGVVGTIRKFGSIYVNDLRIAYPKDVAVSIDGTPASPADLRIGQVVRVVASGDRRLGYSTHAIEVESEVLGPIESAGPAGLTVVGQKVSLSQLPQADRSWKAGDFVAVYGLRRPDGTIVASLVSRRRRAPVRLAGAVALNAAGEPAIGGATLRGLDRGLVGQRVVVTGPFEGGVLHVATQYGEEAAFVRSGVRRVLIEGFVERRNGAWRFGSGLRLFGSPSGAAGIGMRRAVVQAQIGPRGVLRVEALHPIPAFHAGGAPFAPGGRSRLRPGAGFGRPGGGPKPRGGGPAGPRGGRVKSFHQGQGNLFGRPGPRRGRLGFGGGRGFFEGRAPQGRRFRPRFGSPFDNGPQGGGFGAGGFGGLGGGPSGGGGFGGGLGGGLGGGRGGGRR